MKIKFILIISLVAILYFHLKSFSQEPFWELNMLPNRGSAFDFNIMDDQLYIGSYNGIFRSTDLGENWNYLTLNEIVSPIVNSDGVIFCRRIKQIKGFYTWKYFKSYNNGDNWTEVKGSWDTSNLYPHFLISHNNKIIVGPHYGIIHLYESDDLGITWKFLTLINPPELELRNINKFVFVNNSIILIGLDYDYHNKIFISHNNGKNWSKISFGNLDLTCWHFKSETNFFIGTHNGIYETQDAGNSWEKKWLDGYDIFNIFLLNDEKIIIAVIVSNDTKHLIISSDSGKVWSPMNSFDKLNYYRRSPSEIIIDSEGDFYCNPEYYGIFKSSNNGKIWEEKNNGFSAMSPSYFIFNDSSIYMSCWGIFESNDAGKNFKYLDLKFYNTGQIAINSKNDIFVGAEDKGVIRSTDGGISWIPLIDEANLPDAIIINSNDVLFTATLGNLRRSTDNGESWEYIYSPLASCLATNSEGEVFAFSFDYPESGQAKGIWRSADDGTTWEKVGGGGIGFMDPSTTEPSGIIVFNNHTKSAWYGPVSNNDAMNPFWGIFKTTDNGRSWKAINFYNKNVDWYPSGHKVAVDSLGCWVATRNGEKYGIYRSCDNGETWQRLDTSGLMHTEFGPIGVSPDGHIYVFGGTGGLYRSRDAYVSVSDKSKQKPDLFNIPNPFTDLTQIKFQLEESAHVKMEVFDLLGNKLQSKDYGLLDAGESTILFDGQSLPSGIYFYRITSRKQTISGYMNFIR